MRPSRLVEVPDGWEVKKLGEVLELNYGKALKRGDRSGGPFPVYGSSGVVGTHGASLVKGPGIIVGRKGNVGSVFWSEDDFFVIDTAYFVTSALPLRFLFYLLPTLNFLNSDAAVPGLSRRQAYGLEILLPPAPLQQRIAGIVSAYDELIENCQRRINILESIARALYREWFVHFRFPGHENLPRAPSALGEIPEGWQVSKLGDVAETFRGRSYRSADLASEGGLPFINLKCIDRDGGFRRSRLKRYVGEYKASHTARKGDIVIAVTDMTQERRIVARAGLLPSLGTELGICSMDIVRVEPTTPISKAFLYSLLRFSSFADEVKRHANGANVLHLSPERITDFRFVLPAQSLRKRYSDFARAEIDEIDTLENQIANLRRTRDLLLPRLLSGQLELEAA